MLHRFAFLLLPLLGASPPVSATQPDSDPVQPRESADTVEYPAAFFARYQPITARDMVEQVPGFQIRDGAGTRGFSGASGNVLINGERPSSKQDRVSQILERIPAERVVRIDLMRGNTGRFDASGQSVLVNVIVDSRARTWAWEATVEQDLDSGGPTPGASLSLVDQAGNTEWGAGLELSTGFFGNPADERVFVAEGVTEKRREFERTRFQSIRFNGNSATRFGESLLRLNGEIRLQDSDFRENSRRMPVDSPIPAFNLDRRSDDDQFDLEFGTDFRWPLAAGWGARTVGLYRRNRRDDLDQLLRGPDRGNVEVRQQADSKSVSTESIARLEIDFDGIEPHLFELDIEAALNTLDNELDLLVTRDGLLEAVEVPGANNRVEELRGDFQLRDTWQGEVWSVESTLGAEVSEISQTGSGAPDQQFFFVKPSLTLIRAPNERRVDRIGLVREVAQLDFGDFVSSTNFSDEDIDRGNPGLEPQQTWLAEASTEHRFGEVGVAKLGVFHRWVRDVQDRLPVDGRFEVPGNIGNGRRWGVMLEGTVPLDFLFRVGQSRIDFETEWQDSRVDDPVTGNARKFSGRREFEFEAELRHDLTGRGWAWGMETEYENRSILFELDEIDIDDRGFDLEAFVETTRYLGVKMQLEFQNLLDRKFIRDRTVFAGPRDTAEIEFRELRDRRRGRSVVLSISGSF